MSEYLNNKFKIYRNELTKLLKKVKSEYHKKKIDNTHEDPKKLWNAVKEIINPSKTRKYIDKIEHRGHIITDKKEIAEAFNEFFFANIGTLLASKIVPNPETKINIPPRINSMFLSEVSENEIKKSIHQMQSNKAPGCDGITTNALKVCADYIAAPLSYLINLSFSTGKRPQHFKRAVVVPIHKSGKESLIANYRPISLLPSIFTKYLKSVWLNGL